MKIEISYKTLVDDVASLAEKIRATEYFRAGYDSIYAIPRGGVPIGILLSDELDLPLVEKPTDKSLIVDDLVDSGRTLEQYKDYDTAVLYIKPHSPKPVYFQEVLDGWIEFPYEKTEDDEQSVITRLLEIIGEDPTREGLVDTPKRVIKFYKEFLKAEPFNFTTFDSEAYDEMIIQKNIPFFSLCEHHMAPFFGHATVAYIPDGKIVGLSKLARTVEHYSRRLQNQERITTQIADKLQKELKPVGVAVVLEARHFCMEMRGVKTHDVSTTTSKLLGAFKDKPEARAEFMDLLK